MKRKLGVLVLTLASLVTAAGCASSSPSASKPTSPQTDPGETWSQVRKTDLPGRPAKPKVAAQARLASR